MWMWQMEWPNIGDHTSIFQKVKRMQSAYLVILQYKKKLNVHLKQQKSLPFKLMSRL
jgi:hypothetical protein